MQNEENDSMKIVRLGQKEFEGSWSKGTYLTVVFLAVIVIAIAALWPRADKPEQAAPAVTNQVTSNQQQTVPAAMPAETKTNTGSKIVTFTIKPVLKS